MATCSKMAMSGMRPMAAPSSKQISENPKTTVVLPTVRLTVKAGKPKGGSPDWISPVHQIKFEIMDECKNKISDLSE